jgi:hypothetical protein
VGRAIVYCAQCQTRLSSEDFEKGAAFEVGASFYCKACAAKALPSLPEPGRDVLERKIGGASPTSSSSAGLRPIAPTSARYGARPGSTARLSKVTPERQGPVLPVALGAGAILLLALAFLFFSGGRRDAPKNAAPGKIEARPAAVDGDRNAPARPLEDDPAARDRAALDDGLRASTLKDDFRGALDLLGQAAGRGGNPAWKGFVEERLRVTREKALLRGRNLTDAALSRKSEGELRSLRARLLAWELPGQVAEIDRALAALAAAPDSALAGHWKLDEGSGTLARDSSPAGNAGTLRKGAAWEGSPGKAALALGGSGAFVEVPAGESLDITGEITVGAWVKLSATGRDQKILGRQDGSRGGYKLGIWSDNKVEFEIRDASNAVALCREASGGTALAAGTWYHVAALYSQSGKVLRTYVNGTLDREVRCDTLLGSTSGSLKFGREPYADESYLSGALRDVRVFRRALGEAEIQAMIARDR